MKARYVNPVFIVSALVALCTVSAQAADGYGRNATGGAGGASVTVTTPAQLRQYAESTTPYIITVSGTINVDATGVAVKVKSNKTIKGANSSATVIGNLDLSNGGVVNNVIIQNLRITNPGGDGINVYGCTNVFITKCEVFDCADGLIDVSDDANWITISWCKFHYPSQSAHRFANIVGRATDPAGFLRVTMHHNWWGNRCDQRMPAGSKSLVHLYNNYWNCTGNYYCTSAGDGATWLSQNNFYQSVNSPTGVTGGGRIKWTGNTYNNCTGNISPSSSTGITPNYAYTLDSTSSVPSIVQNGAGNR